MTARVAACHDRVIEVVAEHRRQAGGREKLALTAMGRSAAGTAARLGADEMTGSKSNASPSLISVEIP